MMVCVIAVVLVRLAGVVAARTRYDAVVSFGQDFASRRAAAAGCSALDSPPLRPMQSAVSLDYADRAIHLNGVKDLRRNADGCDITALNPPANLQCVRTQMRQPLR